MTEREAALLKKDLEAAREEIEKAREELRRAARQVADRDGEIERLKLKVKALMMRLFGASSEKLDPAQLQMLLDGLEGGGETAGEGDDGDEEQEKPKRKKRGRGKGREPRLPQNTRVVVETIIPEAVRNNPEEWEQIGEPECSELIDYIPEEFVIRRTLRPKYRHRFRRELPPALAAAPAPPIPGAACTEAFAAQLLYAKYVLHQPLYRQEFHYLIRHGAHLPRSTLERWLFAAAERLRPVGAAIELEVLAYSYQQVDESPHRYLMPGRGRAAEGYIWVHNVPGGPVCYRWHTSRSRACLEDFLVDELTGELRVEGTLTLQSDAYSVYPSFASNFEGVVLLGCMAHVRRPFYEAMELGERRYSPVILLHIRNLYAIEQRLREQKAGPALREAVRASESVPILRRLYKIIETARARTLPQAALGKALDYALRTRQLIEACFADGRHEIDNNLTENAIRVTKLGQKNWLFIGSAEAGWAAALIYTLVENCKRNGLDPYAYLREVLGRLPAGDPTPAEVAHLTPARLAAAKRAAARTEAA